MNNIAYNDFGQATSIAIGASTSNPITESYTFDSQTGLMSSQKVQRGTNTLMELEYYYDRGQSKGTLNGTTGQLTKIIDKKDPNKGRAYEFDTLGRLIKAKGGSQDPAVPAIADWTQNYSFDRYGNKTATTSSGHTGNNQTIPLDGLPSQSFDQTTNRINEAGYDYDKAGNLIYGKAPDGSWQRYEYDTAGRLRYVKDDTGWIQQSNEYASSRQRLASWSYASVDITYYAWGGSSVLAEYTTQYSSSSLTWQKSYIYAGSRLLSTITNTAGSEVTEYHHPDRLGTRLITNPVGATQVEQNTLPFGTSIDAETSGTSNQRFTSYDRSGTTGLDYAVNRTYSSGQSRFTQVDPIGMASASIGNPQSLNLFAYVQNNPIDFTDPSGLLMAQPNIGRFIVTIQISWFDQQWSDYWGADNGWGGFGGDTGRRTPRDPGEPGGGNSGSGSAPTPPPDNNCGLNPITKEPGILNDKPSKANPAKNPQGTGRVGARGNIRAGNGGLGGFKERSGDGHNGIDIASPVNQLVFASLDGVVERSNQVKGLGKTPKERGGASQNYGWGGLVVINYNDMALNGVYAHLSHVYVKEGDTVKAGDLIGLTGRTGNANNPSQPSGDDHLHYGRFTGEYTGGSLGGKPWIDPQRSLNSKCPPKPKT